MTANDTLNIDFHEASTILQEIVMRYNCNTFYGFTLTYLILHFHPGDSIHVKLTIHDCISQYIHSTSEVVTNTDDYWLVTTSTIFDLEDTSLSARFALGPTVLPQWQSP